MPRAPAGRTPPTPATASPAAPGRGPSRGWPAEQGDGGPSSWSASRPAEGRDAGASAHELRVERDIDRAVQQLGDRADLLGLLRRGLEGGLVGAGDLRLD